MKKAIKRDAIRELGSAEKTILIDMLQEKNNLLQEQINRLKIKLKKFEGQLSKNSENSSKPPSTDTNKQKKTTSSKEKSGKKPGGQPGHKGHYLKMSKTPDEIIKLEVSKCENCGHDLKNTKSNIERRQEFEIPEPKMLVKEYQAESKDCKCCGYTTVACFPEGITHITQYGARARSLMVYINQYQFVPFERGSQFFEAVYGHKISPGTIVNAVDALAYRLENLDKQIKNFLAKDKLAHCDETSMSVGGHKHWLHTVGNEKLAHFALHTKRGKEATQDIGILPNFRGTMIHDHWKSYFFYKNSKHALCNSHHLRELRFINEHHNMKWASSMSTLLLNINSHKKKHLKAKKSEFSTWILNKYSAKYDELLVKGKKEHVRKSTKDSHNLLKRLTEYKQETLLFMYDFTIPFTNNLSEQDLRMAKVKQKISGCFRQLAGGNSFCKIRNLLISGRKNKKNIFHIIQEAFHKIISVEDIITTF